MMIGISRVCRKFAVAAIGLAFGLMTITNAAKAADEIVLGLSISFSGIYSTIN